MPVKIAQLFYHSLKLRGAWRITRQPPGEKTIVIQSSHLHGILENFAIGAEMQPVAVAVDWQHAQINVFRKPAVQSHFRFARTALPELKGYTQRSVRAVSPSLQRISAWISSVGASVALNDLDGDGLPNDVCYVDPRIDKVVVAPVPGTPQRYAPFPLEPAPLRYDVATMAPMGCLPGDYNEDGLTDILVYYWGRTPILFLNNGANTAKLSGSSYLRQELMPGEERCHAGASPCRSSHSPEEQKEQHRVSHVQQHVRQMMTRRP